MLFFIVISSNDSIDENLQADQVDVRIKAVKFIGRLLSLPGHHVAQEYRHLFIEFTKRFSDKSAEVRLGAISCAKAFYMTNPSRTESLEVLCKPFRTYLCFGRYVLALFSFICGSY